MRKFRQAVTWNSATLCSFLIHNGQYMAGMGRASRRRRTLKAKVAAAEHRLQVDEAVLKQAQENAAKADSEIVRHSRRWASFSVRYKYPRAALSLTELLPIRTGSVSHATIRSHTLTLGARLDQEVTEPDEYDWPESRREHTPTADGLSIAIDETYSHANRVMVSGDTTWGQPE
jgi:outer membrane murein-binding lipoprotein Lpp